MRRKPALSAAWVFVPALGAPLVHAPVLAWDLFPRLRTPINARLFGENKTWRGALFMTMGPVLGAMALYRLPAFRRQLPEPVAAANPALVGAALGMALWVGELPNSFVKRRLGIPPGTRRRSPAGLVMSVVDQADWVPVACVLLRPIWRMNARQVAEACVVVAAVHVPINLIGYALGARTTRI
jgi:hypothetical protein